jgi:5-methylcytosine-specific restriction endonuclease McrA
LATRKPKTVAKLKQEAATLLQKLVRMKYADDNGMCECVTCGKVDLYKYMDGGHFVSRRHNATLLVEENIHPQCKGCNNHKNGNIDSYSVFMIDTYGLDAMKELVASKHQPRKFIDTELLELIAEYKRRIKEQEERLAGV